MNVSRDTIKEMMSFLDMISDKARALGAYAMGYSKIKHLRHESKWASFGLQTLLEDSLSPDFSIDVIRAHLIGYFKNPPIDSVKMEFIALIVQSFEEGRLPTEKEVCICYKIRKTTSLDI